MLDQIMTNPAIRYGAGIVAGAIPADRAPGDGMVAVDRAKLSRLLAEVDDVLDRYESGNPIQAGELYSAFEALRANQGGRDGSSS